MTRHPELTELVERLRGERPRPKLRWSELVARGRASRTDDARRVEQDKALPLGQPHA